MKDMTYCKSWFRAKKMPTQIWDEEKARKAHKSKEPYTVLIGDAKHPQCFIEIHNDFVGVCFLDEQLRESLTYQFQEIEDDKLFLTMATYREFEEKTDKVINGTSYIFGQDGSIGIRKETFNPHSIEISNSKGDVSSNYEHYPDFGQYSRIAVVERSNS